VQGLKPNKKKAREPNSKNGVSARTNDTFKSSFYYVGNCLRD